MAVNLHSQGFQTLLERLCRRLALISGQHHAPHIKADAPELVNQPEHVGIIGDPQIPPHLIFFNIGSINGNHQLRLIRQL